MFLNMFYDKFRDFFSDYLLKTNNDVKLFVEEQKRKIKIRKMF
jgi:hypothetical protein